MSFKFNGTIKVIGSEVQVTDKFKKREFVVTDASSMYPQHVTFQLTQDKCSLLDAFREGQSVEVSFNLDGKEYTDKKTGEIKHFNSLNAWRIEAATANVPQPTPVPETPTAQPASTTEEEDDLPF